MLLNTSIVVVDDHFAVREGLISIFQRRPGFHIIGQCCDGLLAVDTITTLKPDFAFVDLNLPKLHGIEVVRQLCAANCPTKMIVLTVNRDAVVMRQSFRSGARGYVLKDGPAWHLFDAIQSIKQGRSYISPLMWQQQSAHARHRERGEYVWSILTRREYDVFCLFSEGIRARDIATLLEISPKTVDAHRSNIMRKLGAYNIVDLVKLGLRGNLPLTMQPCPASAPFHDPQCDK